MTKTQRTSSGFWSKVDWRKSTRAISLETGVHPVGVQKQRRKHAPETLKAKFGPGVDWSLKSAEIARKHGVSIWTVYHARIDFAPETRRFVRKKVVA